MAAPSTPRYGDFPQGPANAVPAPPVPPPGLPLRVLTGGSGTFSNGAEVKVPPEAALLVTWITGFSATIQGRYRVGGQLGPAKSGAVYTAFVFSGSLFEGVVPSAGDADVLWEIIPDGYIPFK